MRNVKFCIEFGMLPVKELKERSSTLSCGESEDGIPPEKSLFSRYTSRREGMERTSDGSFPVKRLFRRLRMVSASSFPKVLTGIRPTNPRPGSLRTVTRVPFESQETPIQEVQTGVLEFQLSLRPWGTAAAKSRRASLSTLRSAILSEARNRNNNKGNAAKPGRSLMEMSWF